MSNHLIILSKTFTRIYLELGWRKEDKHIYRNTTANYTYYRAGPIFFSWKKLK